MIKEGAVSKSWENEKGKGHEGKYSLPHGALKGPGAGGIEFFLTFLEVCLELMDFFLSCTGLTDIEATSLLEEEA